MKKKIIVLFTLVFCFHLLLSAIPIEVFEPSIYDDSLGKLEAVLHYDSEDNLYVKGGSFLLSISEYGIVRRFLFYNEFIERFAFAIKKSQEWKQIAIKNNVMELQKNIFSDSIEVPSFIITALSPVDINFNFRIERKSYWLVLTYKTVEDRNYGRKGSDLFFKIDSNIEKLKIAISKEKIAEYKKEIDKKKEEESLFN